MAMNKVSTTKRTTLYKLVEGALLEDGLLESRRQSSGLFTVEPLTIESLDALLVYGAVSAPSKWSADVAQLTGRPVEVSNTSPGAVLLIKDSNGLVWALCWGIGFHFLDSERVDFGFGTRVVARSALPSEIKSITKTILDHRARVDRSSLLNGSTIRDLGVDGYGEVVSRIEAKGRIADLSVGDGVIQLRAADSLNLPLARKPAGLKQDLKTIATLLGKRVLPGLESIEQLVALKPKDARVAGLEAKLLDALGGGGNAALNLSWPRAPAVSAPARSVWPVRSGEHGGEMFDRRVDYPCAVASYDDEGVHAAIEWSIEHMDDGDTLTVWTSLKSNLRNCSKLERLVSQQSNVDHVTGRGGGFIRGNGPVLMAWADMEDIGKLAQLGGHGIRALCVITWNENAIRPWVAAMQPVILGDDSGWEELTPELDPVVVEAMKSLTLTVNHNNTISAGFEKDMVVSSLLALHDAGIRLDGGAIQGWALAKGALRF